MHELKNFSEIPYPPKQPAKVVVDRKPRREAVVGSDIKWKPIDQVAARVVAPAPWYCKPLELKPMKTEFPEKSTIKSTRKLTENGYVETLYDRDCIMPQAVDSHIKEAKENYKDTEELLNKARDLADSVSYLLTHFPEPWKEYSERVKKELEATRQIRFALENETRLMMAQFKEVRKFFLDEDYEEQVKRLSEFVSLCERLKALKEDGFLDTVADTMLRLA